MPFVVKSHSYQTKRKTMKINFKTYKKVQNLAVSFLMMSSAFGQAQTVSNQERPRIIITADPELDDSNSMIRFLLYSSDLDIDGLVYASSAFHWKGDGKGTKWFVPSREYSRFGTGICPCESWRWGEDEKFIHDAVDAYAKSYSNLKVHNPNYPSPEVLKSKIKYGNIEFDGDISKDSEGSNLIKAAILDNKPGKLYVTAWGGLSTIARALKSIQEEFENTTDWEKIQTKVARKLVILPSGDQDDTYASYIKPNWPKLDYREFVDGPNYGYTAPLKASPENAKYFSADWMKKNISHKGAFGELYRVWGDGKQMVKNDIVDFFGFSGVTAEELKKQGYKVWMPLQPKGSFLSEGDNFTFMNMLGNGLRAYESGSYGGWGGIEPASKASSNMFFDNAADGNNSAEAMANSMASKEKSEKELAFPNFLPQAMNDFAARLTWSTTSTFSKANHEPVVKILGPTNIRSSAGEKVPLYGSVTDPDGNKVTIKWWQFKQAGTYNGDVEISKSDSLNPEIIVPKTAKSGQTIHLILEATDNGTPALTRYQRVIITVR
ncbi:Protein of unknown function [Chryseobacterium arachidis]|uniref:DUF1593 domain-containing protein n=3 Tax=Chryseobacterium arachidis TaxID=1416778 RepID=A0A1M5L558_9FLAO|nr:Protein of unknown function [Chryseobacterium arachidis]